MADQENINMSSKAKQCIPLLNILGFAADLVSLLPATQDVAGLLPCPLVKAFTLLGGDAILGACNFGIHNQVRVSSAIKIHLANWLTVAASLSVIILGILRIFCHLYCLGSFWKLFAFRLDGFFKSSVFLCRFCCTSSFWTQIFIGHTALLKKPTQLWMELPKPWLQQSQQLLGGKTQLCPTKPWYPPLSSTLRRGSNGLPVWWK